MLAGLHSQCEGKDAQRGRERPGALQGVRSDVTWQHLAEPSFVRLWPQVVVRTSDLPGAGTDANVYVELRGTRGSSTRHVLRNKAINPFERGQVGWRADWHAHAWRCGDAIHTYTHVHMELPCTLAGSVLHAWVAGRGRSAKAWHANRHQPPANYPPTAQPQMDEFEVTAADLGSLTELLIGHDNSGMGPGWHLEREWAGAEDGLRCGGAGPQREGAVACEACGPRAWEFSWVIAWECWCRHGLSESVTLPWRPRACCCRGPRTSEVEITDPKINQTWYFEANTWCAGGPPPRGPAPSLCIHRYVFARRFDTKEADKKIERVLPALMQVGPRGVPASAAAPPTPPYTPSYTPQLPTRPARGGHGALGGYNVNRVSIALQDPRKNRALYKIKVKTSDRSGAGTDANVYIGARRLCGPALARVRAGVYVYVYVYMYVYVCGRVCGLGMRARDVRR
jgi:hypothetical protein